MIYPKSTISVLPHLGFVDGVDYELSWTPDQQIMVEWWSAQPQPTVAEIEAASLAAAKAARIAKDRQECRRRLVDHYGDALEQVSRAAGIYGAVARDNYEAGVQATIDASNAARDQINLQSTDTVAKVEAVIVAWPVLT
jgi:hypothetical protein